jgi:polar amino acid transport system substrate-binding protein
MLTDFANLGRVFRGRAGDATRLPQQWGVPPEEERQHHERQCQPDRQPDQRAAKGFFGVPTVAQSAEQKGKKQADQAVTEIEGHTFERKDRCPSARFDQGVQIVREEKADRDDGRAQREGEEHAPPPPAQCQSCEGGQGNNRDPDEVSCGRTPLHHAARERRDEEAESSQPGPDQTVTGCRQINEPEVRAGEGQEQSDDRVEQQAGQNNKECERHLGNPLTGGQHRLERGFLGRPRSGIRRQGVGRRFAVWLAHADRDHEGEHRRDEVEKNGKTERRALVKFRWVSERASDRVHKPGIIDCAADEHGGHQAHRLAAGDLVEYLGPLCGSPTLSERIKHQCLVRAARQAFGDAAEQSVRKAKKKEESSSADRSHAKDRHFYHHRDGSGNDQRTPSDPIRERAGWQVRADDGNRPGEIQQGILRRGEAEIEEHHRQYRIIKPRVEEHAKKDKAPPVAIGGIAEIGSRHGNSPILSAFACLVNKSLEICSLGNLRSLLHPWLVFCGIAQGATAYRSALMIVTSAFLAVLVLFVGVADSEEPAHAPTVARTRLVVGLVHSPPFCMRGEDGSWSGISVELWQWIAADLDVDTEFRESTVTGVFDDLAPGRPLDVSIGALTITAEREDRLDFSESFFLSGLAVAVKTAPGAGGFWSWLGRLLVWNFWRIVAALIASLVLVALLIWALEHKSNPKEFGGDGKVHRGIGSALWWSAVTMTTVGYGDLAPRSPAGRLVAIAWMFVSLFLVSWFTASMASILTAERLDTGTGGFVVRGPDDLRRLHVAVIAGTSSEDYLRRHQIDYLRIPPKELLDVLLAGRAQAILGDAPTLRYVARSEPYAGKITVLPQTLEIESYGIALRDGSPWRKPVDRALLHRLASPEWRDLLYRYLGTVE